MKVGKSASDVVKWVASCAAENSQMGNVLAVSVTSKCLVQANEIKVFGLCGISPVAPDASVTSTWSKSTLSQKLETVEPCVKPRGKTVRLRGHEQLLI